jgi:two-component sensor histidine kinase
VKSMALLHEALYSAGNMAYIDFGDYVRNLCGQLFLSFGPAAGRITLENRLMDVGLPLENAVPCGLIVNELVSNSLKHAFPGGRTGRVTVSLEPAEGRMIVLSVCDDGVGLPSGLDLAATPTLGLQLVSILSTQIQGQLEAVPFHGAGAVFRVKFPAPENTLLEGES